MAWGIKLQFFKFSFEFVQVQSTPGPPIPPHSGLAKKTAVLENGVKGRNIIYLPITKKKHIRDLKLSSGIGGGL